MPDGELLTPRLRLRRWTTCRDDLARLTDTYSRPEVTRWLGGPPSVGPVELVGRWAEVTRADPRFGCWAIEVGGTEVGGREQVVAGTVLLRPLPGGVGEVEVVSAGEFIGFTGLDRVKGGLPVHGVEIGWRLARSAWGHGYATEAARACLEYGFGTLGLDEIVAIAAAGNTRSQAVMRRLGMTHDPADTFDDPAAPPGSPAHPLVVHRLRRPRPHS